MAGLRGWIPSGIALVAACGARPVTPVTPPPLEIRLVLTERVQGGGRLVAVDERGDRLTDVLEPSVVPARDVGATISPDGRWLVFASSRGRPLNETSLWIAPLGEAQVATRLTDGPAIDLTPAWEPSGQGVVFASTRGGVADLWRVPITFATDGPRPGTLAQLTHDAGAELSPSPMADGSVIYAAATLQPDGAMVSRLERRWPDGRITPVTEGPADSTPAVAPDGTTVAFARPMVRVVTTEGQTTMGAQAGTSHVDSEIFVAPLSEAGAGHAQVALPLPFTDESSPAWSADGQFLLATSLARDVRGEPVLSSVVHVDRREAEPVVRMLVDRAGAVTRMGVAIGPQRLNAQGLHLTPRYREELARILLEAANRNLDAGEAP